MKRIWEFVPWLPYTVDPKRFVSHCRFVNDDEVFEAGMTPGEERLDPFPVPQLELTLDDFVVDCFILQGLTLVSQKMRLAMNSTEIEYFEVNSARSSPQIIEKNYAVMSVCVLDQVSFPSENVSFSTQDEYLSSLLYGPGDIDILAEPTHEIFHDRRFLGSIFCTDEFAVRVLAANCTGVRFFDPQHREAIRPMRFRTLAGLEEEGTWDPFEKVERTTLIERMELQ